MEWMSAFATAGLNRWQGRGRMRRLELRLPVPKQGRRHGPCRDLANAAALRAPMLIAKSPQIQRQISDTNAPALASMYLAWQHVHHGVP